MLLSMVKRYRAGRRGVQALADTILRPLANSYPKGRD
jgi:hypothetical protein